MIKQLITRDTSIHLTRRRLYEDYRNYLHIYTHVSIVTLALWIDMSTVDFAIVFTFWVVILTAISKR
jgi:hypothetical protein